MPGYNRPRDFKLAVVRHGERLDRVFPQWMDSAWQDGVYKPFDLNMPLRLPARLSPQHYARDSPLTEVGFFQAQSVGRSFQSRNFQIDYIYSSPALRCVQTAMGICKTSEHHENIKINVEPGLFEWMGWYPQTPSWFTVEELVAHNFRVDQDYSPIMTVDTLLTNCSSESKQDYYTRCKHVIERILDGRKSRPCNMVIVAHGPNLDASVRPVLKLPFDVPEDRFEEFGSIFPFCSFVVMQKRADLWHLIEDKFPAFNNNNFDDWFVTRR